MQVSDIRVFIPSKDYQVSQSFYQALGFTMSKASDDLSILESGNSTFFCRGTITKSLLIT
jgi:predicted lactoylglutathione lyase